MQWKQALCSIEAKHKLGVICGVTSALRVSLETLIFKDYLLTLYQQRRQWAYRSINVGIASLWESVLLRRSGSYMRTQGSWTDVQDCSWQLRQCVPGARHLSGFQLSELEASADVTAQVFVLQRVRFLLFQTSVGTNDLRMTLQHYSRTRRLNPWAD